MLLLIFFFLFLEGLQYFFFLSAFSVVKKMQKGSPSHCVLLSFPQPCQQLVGIPRALHACSPSSSLGTSTTRARAPGATTASSGAPPPAATTTTASGASVQTKVTPPARAARGMSSAHTPGSTPAMISHCWLQPFSLKSEQNPHSEV